MLRPGKKRARFASEVADEVAAKAALKSWQALDARLCQIEDRLDGLASSIGAVDQRSTYAMTTVNQRIDHEVRTQAERVTELQVLVADLGRAFVDYSGVGFPVKKDE